MTIDLWETAKVAGQVIVFAAPIFGALWRLGTKVERLLRLLPVLEGIQDVVSKVNDHEERISELEQNAMRIVRCEEEIKTLRMGQPALSIPR